MGTYENRIEHNASQLGWSVIVLAAIASRFGIRGASETNLSKAFRNLKDLDATMTALPLDLLLSRFLAMTKKFEPFQLRLDDPDQAKQLLEDFESGRLVVSISRQEPDAWIQPVYLIESAINRNELFQGVQNGVAQWGRPGAPIKDKAVADAAARLLCDLGHPSHVFLTSVRVRDAKVARDLVSLGFVLQEEAAQ